MVSVLNLSNINTLQIQIINCQNCSNVKIRSKHIRKSISQTYYELKYNKNHVKNIKLFKNKFLNTKRMRIQRSSFRRSYFGTNYMSENMMLSIGLLNLKITKFTVRELLSLKTCAEYMVYAKKRLNLMS